jgi:hypothetical protein
METVGGVEMPVLKERELRYSPSIVESVARDLRIAVAGHVAPGVAVVPDAALLIPVGDLEAQREGLAGVPLHLRNKLAGDGSVVGSVDCCQSCSRSVGSISRLELWRAQFLTASSIGGREPGGT